MAKVKYNRISTTDQNLARQLANSKDFFKIYNDQCSGTIKLSERKAGRQLLKDIDLGIATEVHVNSLCRLGRNLLDVLTMIEHFNNKKINLFVENMAMFSLIGGKPNPSFALIASVLLNISVLEREFLLDRQQQGIAIARQNNKYKGRLNGTTMSDVQILEKYKKVVKELNAGESLRRAAAIGECSLGTAQRVQKILMKKISTVPSNT